MHKPRGSIIALLTLIAAMLACNLPTTSTPPPTTVPSPCTLSAYRKRTV